MIAAVLTWDVKAYALPEEDERADFCGEPVVVVRVFVRKVPPEVIA